MEFWRIKYNKQGIEEMLLEYNSPIGLLQIIQMYLKDFIKKEIDNISCLGYIKIEPIWDEDYQGYLYNLNALNQELNKRGIDMANKPCLKKGECIEFREPQKLVKYIKNKIDKYRVTNENNNELIKLINFLKRTNHWILIDKKLKNGEEYKNNNERKKILKYIIDNYYNFLNSHQSSSFGGYKETNNLKSKPDKDPNKDKTSSS